MRDDIITMPNNVDPECLRLCWQHKVKVCSNMLGALVPWVYGELKWLLLGEGHTLLKLCFSYDLIGGINHRYMSVPP